MCTCLCAHDHVSIVALIIHCCSTCKCAQTLRWLFNQAKDLHGLQHMWHTKDVILRRFIGSNWVMSSSWIIKSLFRSRLDLHILPHITHTHIFRKLYMTNQVISTFILHCGIGAIENISNLPCVMGSIVKTLKGNHEC